MMTTNKYNGRYCRDSITILPNPIDGHMDGIIQSIVRSYYLVGSGHIRYSVFIDPKHGLIQLLLLGACRYIKYLHQLPLHVLLVPLRDEHAHVVLLQKS